LDLANKLTKQKNINVVYQPVVNADHFFRNKLDKLETIITEYLQTKVLKQEETKAAAQKLYL
jgi:alpha/beta superfamily hydrolase